MKDTGHPIRHPRVHSRDGANGRRRRSCARQKGQTGPRNGTKLGWNDPTFAHDSLAKASLGSLQPNKKLLLSARVRGENLGEAGEEGRNYLLHLRLHHLLHVVMRISLGKRESKRHENEKSDAEKAPDRAGATPLLCALSRPKFRGVAPALLSSSCERVLRGRVE
jgi:hypothetical protein